MRNMHIFARNHFWNVLSSCLFSRVREESAFCFARRLAHNVPAELVWEMRGARKAALANVTDKYKPARAVETQPS